MTRLKEMFAEMAKVRNDREIFVGNARIRVSIINVFTILIGAYKKSLFFKLLYRADRQERGRQAKADRRARG